MSSTAQGIKAKIFHDISNRYIKKQTDSVVSYWTTVSVNNYAYSSDSQSWKGYNSVRQSNSGYSISQKLLLALNCRGRAMNMGCAGVPNDHVWLSWLHIYVILCHDYGMGGWLLRLSLREREHVLTWYSFHNTNWPPPSIAGSVIVKGRCVWANQAIDEIPPTIAIADDLGANWPLQGAGLV